MLSYKIFAVLTTILVAALAGPTTLSSPSDNVKTRALAVVFYNFLSKHSEIYPVPWHKSDALPSPTLPSQGMPQFKDLVESIVSKVRPPVSTHDRGVLLGCRRLIHQSC